MNEELTVEELAKALQRSMVETGSLVCLGCGYEHNCSTRGCKVMREAADALESLATENKALLENNKALLSDNESCRQTEEAALNEPLTIKQLREMIGQWVWVESKDVSYPNGWYRVEPQFRETISLAGIDGICYETPIVNGDASAYRRPPDICH
ncbi:MAG: hypothetical protein E7572_03980 [Ruminococcaceae bacterium]|nr:hypothetical protein [Oscillospiraceae bacterium]